MQQIINDVCQQTNELFIKHQAKFCPPMDIELPPNGFEYAHDFVNNGCCYLWAALVKARLNQIKIRSSIVGQPSHVYLQVDKRFYDSFLWTGTDNPLDISENAVYLDNFSDYSYRKLNLVYAGELQRKANILLELMPTTAVVWRTALQNILKGCNQ